MSEVVFLHGFLGAPTQLEPVAPGARGVALPGHGLAPWFPDGDAFDACVDAIADRVAGGATAPILVGYSMGARLALAVILRRPGLARAAVLVGVDAGIADPAARAARDDLRRLRVERLRSSGLRVFLDAWEREAIFATQASLDPSVLAAQRAARAAHTERGVAWALEHLDVASQPVLDVSRVDVPITFLAGERDERFASIAARLAARAPRGRAVIARGAGHNLLLEAPVLVAREIRHQETSAGREPAFNQGSPS